MKKKIATTCVLLLLFGRLYLHAQTEYGLTVGLVMDDQGTTQTSSYPGATLSLGVFHKKTGLGIRYRKDFGHDFYLPQTGTFQLRNFQLEYYAENYIEVFKTFRFSSKKAYKAPQFTIGAGYGRINANTPTVNPTQMLSFFASMPIHWFSIEFRIRPLLVDPFRGPAIGGGGYVRPNYERVSIAFQTSFMKQVGKGERDTKPPRKRKMQYPFTVGLVFNDNLSHPIPGATLSFGAFHKKTGIGIRYRKDVWFDFSSSGRVDSMRSLNGEIGIQYHEENYIELYKTFCFKSDKPDWDPQFTIGGGYGQIFPYFERKAARVSSIFVSVPIKWVTLEARARPFLHDPYEIPDRARWGRGTPKYQLISLAVQTTFPRRYSKQ